MKILRNISDLKKAIIEISDLGFVPTMGGLHNGHISLIKESINSCKKTLITIYVNPAQFNNNKDFNTYPRNIKKDLKVLEKLKVDFVFLPNTDEIYKKKRGKKIKINSFDKILCAKFRKGHFEGVLDIIDRFIKIINPKYIFLGEKDFQQLFLIKKFIKKKYKTKIYLCKTIRDKNFAALSTRNYLLSKKELIIAGKVAKKLNNYKKLLVKNTEFFKDILKIKKTLIEKFKVEIEYLEIRNIHNLKLYKGKGKLKLFIAYYINGIRIIDNF